MDSGGDLIEQLLQTTGLSCEDLLAKLQQYRSVKSKPNETTTKSDESEAKAVTSRSDTQCSKNDDTCTKLERQIHIDSDTKNDTDISKTQSVTEPDKEDILQTINQKEKDSKESTCQSETTYHEETLVPTTEVLEETKSEEIEKDENAINDERENAHTIAQDEKSSEDKNGSEVKSEMELNLVCEVTTNSTQALSPIPNLVSEETTSQVPTNSTQALYAIPNLVSKETSSEVTTTQAPSPSPNLVSELATSTTEALSPIPNVVTEETIEAGVNSNQAPSPIPNLISKETSSKVTASFTQASCSVTNETNGSEQDEKVEEDLPQFSNKQKDFAEDSEEVNEVNVSVNSTPLEKPPTSADCSTEINTPTETVDPPQDEKETTTKQNISENIKEVNPLNSSLILEEDVPNDHNYSTHTDLPTKSPVSTTKEATLSVSSPLNTPDLPKSEDIIRNSIRMQLSSLRNMKKSTGYLPKLNTTSLFFHNLKKKRKSCEMNTTNADTKESSDEKEGISSNENSWVSLAEETEFVILDVTGGVDRLTPEIKEEKRNFAEVNEDIKESTEKPEMNVKFYKKKKLASTRFDGDKVTPETSTVFVKKNISESFNRDPGINKSVTNSEKSPFVSDSLEDFLNESSELQISYAIPKLGAEEGIGESTKTCPFDGRTVKKTQVPHQRIVHKEKPKLVKAKTLAEMRRQFEKLKAAEQGITLDKRTKAYKESLKDISKLNQAVKKVANDETLPRNSFIIFNDRKVWTTSNLKDGCLGVVRSKVTKNEIPNELGPKKPSLLSSLSQTRPYKVTYKPGPLCKKADLQNTDNLWTSELKTLPKIYLEVTPQVHKPIDPTLVHLLPTFDDPVVSEERANFALSVLKPKDTNIQTESFNFHIPYRNKQEKVIVRKPCKPLPVDKEEKQSDPETDIKNVLNDLITYIEVKEIEDSLIKEDNTVEEPVATNTSTSPRTKKKVRRKKLDLELRRLNCKVIDVATNESDNVNCLKPFCKLGCVCKSLLCESLFSNHCQLVECMFDCKCPSRRSEALSSKDSLSVHTVNHLEDIAKKNLAKEEKEFTQTLIHTDNDAILVGTAKMRRSTKPPKKYTDYIGNDFFEHVAVTISDQELQRAKRCEVVVHKMDAEGLVPLCLYHNMYYCACGGKTPIQTKKIVEQPKKVEPVQKKPADQIPKIRIVRTKEDQNKAWYDSCARIRKVFSQYKERNKSTVYNQKLRKNFNKAKVSKPDGENVAPLEVQTESPKKPNKRKQSFNVRQDTSPVFSSDKEFALQRRKKKLKPNVTPATDTYSPVFDGEIKLSLHDNRDIVAMIGNDNSSLEYLRILPWSKLIDGFQTRKMDIWAKEKKATTLVCNTVGHLPPKGFIDIRRVKNRSEIIDWILTDTLPAESNRSLMHLILTPKQGHFLIAGYCLKKMNTNVPAESVSSSSKTGQFEEVYVDAPSDNFDEIIDVEGHAEPMIPVKNKPVESSPKSGVGRKKTKTQSVLIDELVKGKAKKLKMVKMRTGAKLEVISYKERVKYPFLNPDNPSSQALETQVSPKLPVVNTLKRTQEIKKADGPVPEKKHKYNDLLQSLTESLDTETETTDVSINNDLAIKELLEKLSDDNDSQSNEPDGLTITELIDTDLCKKTKEKGEKTRIEDLKKPEASVRKINDSPSKRRKDKDSKSEETISKSDPLQKPEDRPKVRDPLEILGPKPKEQRKSPEKLKPVNPKLLDNSPPPSCPETQNQDDSLELSEVRNIILSRQTKSNLSKLARGQDKPGTGTIGTGLSSRSLKCTHKDMFNKTKVLVLTNKVFVKRNLHTNHPGKESELSLPLPQVSKNVKWRMIYLNSDFTYLTFTKVNYSVKYTDLMDVVKMSSNIKATITLRNKEFCDHYKHPLFGIFCVPDYQDRLFLGPYLLTESHDTETLRYLQGRLIDTVIFNNMVGRRVGVKDPLWLYEVAVRPVSLPNDLVIDITADDDPDVVELDSEEEEPQHLADHLLCSPFVEELSAEELRVKRNINRYIMTNIPHLGYFDACQRDSTAIEVFWPGGSKGYRFPNVTFAKNLLTQYLSQIFCPISEEFKINVIIMTNLGVQNNQPIDTKYFSEPGPFFCGEFGVYEKESLPEDLLKKCNVSSVDALLRTHKENVETEDAMIRIFGLFLMSNEELHRHSQPENILKWALSEIYILKKLSDNYDSEKTDLKNMIRANARAIHRKRELLKKTRVLNTTVSETIEIEDSDEENSQGSVEPHTPPVFRKISTSGRIDPEAILNGSNGRSLLKPSVVIKAGHSLLKSSDKKKQLEAIVGKVIGKRVKLMKTPMMKKNNLLTTEIK